MKRPQSFREVEDQRNPSISTCIQKAGIEGVEGDTLFIDLVRIRFTRADVYHLHLSPLELEYAEDRPYRYLVENSEKLLAILDGFWEWVVLTSTSPVVEVYGEVVNERITTLVSRLQSSRACGTESIKFSSFSIFKR